LRKVEEKKHIRKPWLKKPGHPEQRYTLPRAKRKKRTKCERGPPGNMEGAASLGSKSRGEA